MDLANINIPEHVVGKSLQPCNAKNDEYLKASSCESALTRWRKGYSIKNKTL